MHIETRDGWLVIGIALSALATIGLICNDHFRPVRHEPPPTRILLAQICQTISMFKMKMGQRLPSSLQDLQQLISEGIQIDPQLYGSGVNDSWGHPIKYTVYDDNKYELRSFGPDGVEGTKDDIVR